MTDDEVKASLIEARRLLEAEVELLCQSHPPSIVQYVVITAAIKLGQELGQSPGQFCKTVAKVVGLYCGEKPVGSPHSAAIESHGGE